MLINNIDIRTYNCICLKFMPSLSNYKFEGSFIPSKSFKLVEGQHQEQTREIDASFIFKGTKVSIQKNLSRFIENIKTSTISAGGFLYDVIYEHEVSPDVVTNNSVKLNMKLTLKDQYQSERSITFNANRSLTIDSPKPCMANLEVSANTNVIEYKLYINSNEITIRNIKGNELIIIGEGEVTANGVSKIEDVDIWEFPQLDPGINQIRVNRSDVNVKIKYKQRW